MNDYLNDYPIVDLPSGIGAIDITSSISTYVPPTFDEAKGLVMWTRKNHTYIALYDDYLEHYGEFSGVFKKLPVYIKEALIVDLEVKYLDKQEC